jgi:hypothetical protein
MVRLHSLFVLLSFVSASASAATYPVSARLRMGAPGSQHCLTGSENGQTDCSVVNAAEAAFRKVVARMFKASETPDLDFVLSVDEASLQAAGTESISVELRTTVRVLSPRGQPIDEIHDLGRALERRDTPVDRAMEAAAEAAASEFEERYGWSSKISDYLVVRKIASRSAVALPPRSDRLFWLAVAGGLVQGSGDGGTDGYFSGRLGATYRWVMLQASFSRYSSSFTAQAPDISFPADLNTNDLGIEAALVLHIGRNFEIRGGPGLHYLFGAGAAVPTTDTGLHSLSAPFSETVPTVFGSVLYSFVPVHGGMRFFGGLEGRGYFSTTTVLPSAGRSVAIANTTFAVFLGIELPWGSQEVSP